MATFSQLVQLFMNRQDYSWTNASFLFLELEILSNLIHTNK